MSPTLKSILLFSFIVEHINFAVSQQTPATTAVEAQEDDQANLYHCDPEKCDLIVNKCKFLDKCNCDFKKDVDCTKDCIDCLEEKLGDCCRCVGLCNSRDNELHASHVGETSNSDDELFEVLTESNDIYDRWTVAKLDSGVSVPHPELGRVEMAYRKFSRQEGANSSLSYDNSLEKVHCTVAFMNRELSLRKCRQFCTSMGSRYFRWFHNGCCECVGRYCLQYGIHKPLCDIPLDT